MAFNLMVGLVTVPVKLRPLSKSTSIPGKRICPEHKLPVNSGKATCPIDGHEVEEPVTGFEVAGGYVAVDRKDHRSERDGMVQLKNAVELSELDPGVFEKTYYAEPEKGGEVVYDVIAAALKSSGKALIGKTTMTTSTKAIAFKWSDEFNCIVGHVLSYDEALKRSEAQRVGEAMAGRPKPNAEHVEMAEQLLGGLSSDFELGDVHDDYRESLQAAIDAAANGLPAPAAPKTAAPAEVGDLMEALRKSVAGSKPKPKRKPAAKKKAAA